jgi:hypothetical protein
MTSVKPGDHITLIPGIEGYPPTSSGGNYVVSAVDEAGRLCVDGLARWLEPQMVARIDTAKVAWP